MTSTGGRQYLSLSTSNKLKLYTEIYLFMFLLYSLSVVLWQNKNNFRSIVLNKLALDYNNKNDQNLPKT